MLKLNKEAFLACELNSGSTIINNSGIPCIKCAFLKNLEYIPETHGIETENTVNGDDLKAQYWNLIGYYEDREEREYSLGLAKIYGRKFLEILDKYEEKLLNKNYETKDQLKRDLVAELEEHGFIQDVSVKV